MAKDPVLPLDGQLCFSIYSASIAIQRVYKPMLDELGVTYTQYLVLSALWERDGLTIGASVASPTVPWWSRPGKWCART